MTYGDMLVLMQALDKEQLQMDVTIHLADSGEYVPITSFGFPHDDDRLDANHPVITVEA